MSNPGKAVFLSYAREDTDVARRIAEALRAFGVEVWFDQSELRGGDAWDQKIRRQIKDCALFLPIISEHTQARGEGYFRLEWKLAAERTHLMAEGMPFVLPLVVDGAQESEALVPPEFMRVQWTRLPQGVPSSQFVEQIKRLLATPSRPALIGASARSTSSATAAKSRFPLAWVTSLAAALLVIAVLVILRPVAPEKPAATPPATPAPAAAGGQKSIAVLPFVNLGADKTDEYLGDGMTEELLNVLAKVKGLRVPGRSSSFAFKGRTDENIFRRVGEQLNVSTVLEGSVRKSGNRVRITVQLINVADGYHLWSETYDRDLTDILGLQSEVARQVVQALQVQLGVEEVKVLAKKATTNPEAHALYLKGRYHHYLYSESDSNIAIECFRQALAIDPGYAMAHAGMAAIYAQMSSVYLPPAEAMPLAKTHVVKALALDETLAEAHHSYACIKWWGDWDFAGAEAEFRRALELNPNDETTHADFADFLGQLGRFPEAMAAVDRAAALNPLTTADHGALLMLQRRYDEAAAAFRRKLALQPHLTLLHFRLAQIYARQGKAHEAIREARLAMAPGGREGYLNLMLATILAQAGEKTEARAMVDGILQTARERYVSPVQIAQLFAALGDHERAFEWLQNAYDTRSDHLLSLNVSPVWDDLRPDPRFKGLLMKIGLVK